MHDLFVNNFNAQEFLAQRATNFGNEVLDDRNPDIRQGPAFKLREDLNFRSPLRGFVTRKDAIDL